jgi:integrase
VRANIEECYQDYLDLYLLTGLRRSDGLLVTSDNFNFEERTATFYQGKTQRHKTLPLTNDLSQVAQRLIDKVGLGQPFVTVDADTLTKSFGKARLRAGLPGAITFHSLRRSFASWLAQAGVDFKTLQSLTGHLSAEALQIYVHTFDPNRRSAIERLQLPKAANA